MAVSGYQRQVNPPAFSGKAQPPWYHRPGMAAGAMGQFAKAVSMISLDVLQNIKATEIKAELASTEGAIDEEYVKFHYGLSADKTISPTEYPARLDKFVEDTHKSYLKRLKHNESKEQITNWLARKKADWAASVGALGFEISHKNNLAQIKKLELDALQTGDPKEYYRAVARYYPKEIADLMAESFKVELEELQQAQAKEQAELVAAEGRKQLSDWLRKGQLNEALLLSVRDVVKPDVYERFSGYLKKPVEQSKRWELSKDIIKGIGQIKADEGGEDLPSQVEQYIDELASIGTPEILEEAESYYAQLQTAVTARQDPKSPLNKPYVTRAMGYLNAIEKMDVEYEGIDILAVDKELPAKEQTRQRRLRWLKIKNEFEQWVVAENPSPEDIEKRLEQITKPEREQITLNWLEKLLLAKESTPFFGKYTGTTEERLLARKREKAGVAPEGEFESVKMQSAPFMEFDDEWGNLSDEQKKSIWDNQVLVQQLLDLKVPEQEILERL